LIKEIVPHNDEVISKVILFHNFIEEMFIDSVEIVLHIGHNNFTYVHIRIN